MSSKTVLIDSLSVLALVILTCCLITSLPTAQPQILDLHGSIVSGAANYLHKVYNASLNWPIILYQNPATEKFFSTDQVIAGLASLCAIGLFLLLKISSASANLAKSFCIALLSPLLLYYLWGSDLVIFSNVAAIPFLTILIYRSLTAQENEWLYLVLVTLMSALIVLLTGIMCIFPIGISLLLVTCIKKDNYPDFPLTRVKRDQFVFFIPIILALLYLGTQGWPILPDYSPLGHVIEDDGLPGNILPLFSPSPSIPVIDRTAIKSIFADLASLQLGLAFIFLLGWGRSTLVRLTLASTFFVWLDMYPSEALSLIAPVACLERLLPGLFYFPLSVLLLASNVIFLILTVARALYSWIPAIATLFLIFAVTTLQQPKINLTAGLFVPKSANAAQQEFERSLSDATQATQEKFLISPSYAVLNKTGLWPLKIPELIKHWQFSTLFKEQPTILASSNGELAKNLTDRDINTRWSPAAGRQAGQEWLYVSLNEPLTIQGIELETGPYHTDFPRGLQVWSQTNCSASPNYSQPDVSGLELLADYPTWEGSIAMTADGYPYFAGQGTGKIYFKQPVTSGCLLIKQIGKTDKFDWSVTQIRVLRHPQ